MPPAAERWVIGLPWRWAIGGFVLALVWVTLSVGLTGGFSSPHGGVAKSFLQTAAWFVIPLAVIGGAWGLSERRMLRVAAADGDALGRAVRWFLMRQIAKSMLCALVFAAFLFGVGPVRALRPWTNETAIVKNISTMLGFALIAVPIGLIVGLVAGRGLKRRLAEGDGPSAVF